MDTRHATALFDRNAETYDAVNRIISAGMDRRWRRWAAEKAVAAPGAQVLDAMAGTGEVGFYASQLGARVTVADTSRKMLQGAWRRFSATRTTARFALVDLTSDEDLPAGPFDAICLSFGLRYVDDKIGLLKLLGSRLAEDGRIVVLEFVEPEPGPLSTPASVYFFRVLPSFAKLLSGDGELYGYLRDSVHDIGKADDLRTIAKSVGLSVAEERTFGFGLVDGLVLSRRPADAARRTL